MDYLITVSDVVCAWESGKAAGRGFAVRGTHLGECVYAAQNTREISLYVQPNGAYVGVSEDGWAVTLENKTDVSAK